MEDEQKSFGPAFDDSRQMFVGMNLDDLREPWKMGFDTVFDNGWYGDRSLWSCLKFNLISITT